MSKLRAKVNIIIAGGERIEAGEVRDAKEVAHLDQADFEEVGEDEETADKPKKSGAEKPKSKGGKK